MLATVIDENGANVPIEMLWKRCISDVDEDDPKIESLSLCQYHVYAYLKRLGFKLLRANIGSQLSRFSPSSSPALSGSSRSPALSTLPIAKEGDTTTPTRGWWPAISKPAHFREEIKLVVEPQSGLTSLSSPPSPATTTESPSPVVVTRSHPSKPQSFLVWTPDNPRAPPCCKVFVVPFTQDIKSLSQLASLARESLPVKLAVASPTGDVSFLSLKASSSSSSTPTIKPPAATTTTTAPASSPPPPPSQ